ncbi:NAD(P)/FAD-dependent oxidoreductase [Mangrovivirga sp. M17]|uniref:NAD(P)/FAD-dependent oxidoreductase n=1 Tax=Mangrovivirga halotolerans TaxID=2993936 RepID=A0ABT3RUE3_9BACT|nr:NAD(P)/FAD-dependent oxidoreductase [Mangrovivirga halotolerans]MCX2745403.1 NAD(P)/FAD-dependent oxidoreductase [Mangrovivirga halotolerans]
MREFDVFVIGSGMAGMTVANKCASEGLSVGITDELPYGGTCALRGCDPKKVLIGATKVIKSAKDLQGKGLDGYPQVNWKDLMSFKKSFTESMPSKIEKGYKKNEISTFHSPARFINENQLKVGDETVKANKIVIATGAQPHKLDIPGGEYAITSTDFLDLDKLPKSLLFVGGGYIAFEFAHLAARCGAEVTIVHRGELPLEKFDPDIVSHLISATEDLGIKLILNTEVTQIQKHKDGYKVIAEGPEESTELFTSTVVNSSGRIPSVFNLDLEKANVKFSKSGIEVNEFFQSVSNKQVYAAGDTANTDGLPLTPVAIKEGHITASNIINGNQKKAEYNAIPTVVFTLPAMASVGLTEEDAKSKDLNFKTNYQSVPEWFNAKRMNEKQYAFKTLIDKDTDKILGAHLIGPKADETINLFVLAMNAGLKASEIKQMIFSYPTLASDLTSML